MPVYAIAATIAVIISAIILFLIFSRLKLMNFRVLFLIALASLISAMALPGIFNIISANKDRFFALSAIWPVTIATVIIYVILAFILSMIISFVIPGNSAKPGMSELQTAAGTVSPEAGTSGENYLGQIYDTMVRENNKENTNPVENVDKIENNLEKSVDTSENIDKMGIENIVQDSGILTVDQCIEEAFKRKGRGDDEEAILYYMYALDKNPPKQLAFWIVLDICVIYKTLGQCELAFEILNCYYDVLGDAMDISVKEEIEKNLSDIRA